jgi:hypothetical protein
MTIMLIVGTKKEKGEEEVQGRIGRRYVRRHRHLHEPLLFLISQCCTHARAPSSYLVERRLKEEEDLRLKLGTQMHRRPWSSSSLRR